MLIYTSCGSIGRSFGTSTSISANYKNASKRKRSGIQKKNLKRIAQRQPSYRQSTNKAVKNRKKKKKLNNKNIKFLKSLGLEVKKSH